MRRIYSLLVGLIFCLNLSAQQYPLFSNYLTAQYGFNPATTGSVTGLNASFLYRKQWLGIPNSPETQLASVRTRLDDNSIGLGAYVFNDAGGGLKRTGANGLFSYFRQLDEQVFLSAGLSFGYHNVRLANDITFKDQDDQTLVNAITGVWIPDINIGLLLELKDFYLGISMPQSLEYEFNFNEDPEATEFSQLQRHFFLSTGSRFQFTSLTVEPSLFVRYIAGLPPQVEGAMKVDMHNDFWFALAYRSEDAIIGLIGYQVNRFLDLSYAYDLTTSELQKATGGSHELTLNVNFNGIIDSDRDGIPDEEDQCPNMFGVKQKAGCPRNLFEEDAGNNDADEDGIINAEDECPNEPGPKSTNGCPLPDLDEDGVPDEEDECPTEAGVLTNKGCPLQDQDGDGIPDDQDACPKYAGIAANQGCPVEDRDNDGIADDKDNCPDTPGVFTNKGCPIKDLDKDGVNDELDECPKTFGTPDNNGCPFISSFERELLSQTEKQLFFNSGAAVITSQQSIYLKQLASSLKKRADWKVVIKGHMDATGPHSNDWKLAQRRAESVANYLKEQGVAPTQLILDYTGKDASLPDLLRQNDPKFNQRVSLSYFFE